MGVVFLELNKPAQALAYLDKALEYDPDHEQALLNSAILLQELNKPELRKISRERLFKLLEKDGECVLNAFDILFSLAVKLKNVITIKFHFSIPSFLKHTAHITIHRSK